MKNRDSLRDLTVFVLLTAIGVVGRWVQPDWNFTPLMAVTVLGGFYFRSVLAATLLPVGILTISNLALDAYDSFAVLASVYAMMIVPMLLGRWRRVARPAGNWRAWAHYAVLCPRPCSLW